MNYYRLGFTTTRNALDIDSVMPGQQLTQRMINHIEDYLRRSARISRMDKIRNEAIKTKMGIKKNIVQEIEEQQLRWYGHVKRMEDGKTVKQVAEWKPQGKRKRGRPINTWKDGIRESMKRRVLKDEECMDQDLSRRKIMSLG
jgi:hypothetical protein